MPSYLMPNHHLKRRDDHLSTSPPALSPSAIVGLCILGAMFLCVALAATLRYFTRPDPNTTTTTSLYRPEDFDQLERMKEVREFNRKAAWERAEEARGEEEMRARVAGGRMGRVGRGKGDWRRRFGVGYVEEVEGLVGGESSSGSGGSGRSGMDSEGSGKGKEVVRERVSGGEEEEGREGQMKRYTCPPVLQLERERRCPDYDDQIV